jgi:hypothetical protein
MDRPRHSCRRAPSPGLARSDWLPWLAGAVAAAAAAALLPPTQRMPTLTTASFFPSAAAQQVHVPRRDKEWKALVDARLPTIEVRGGEWRWGEGKRTHPRRRRLFAQTHLIPRPPTIILTLSSLS